MKKYVTFVKDEEESLQVQEALFNAGFKWCTGSVVVDISPSHHFIVVRGDDGEFFHRTVSGIFNLGMSELDCNSDTIGDLVFIEPFEIITDPFQLDGAKQPEQMIEIDGKSWSKSTIKEALKAYAE